MLDADFNENHLNTKQMKKIFLFFLLALNVMAANAQEYKTFRVILGLGYATPLTANNKSIVGDIFTIEPSYRISDDIAIGLRIEGAVLIDIDLGEVNYDSYTLNGQYYFGETKFRPFVGAGLGWYRVVVWDYNVVTTSKIGFYPRVGFDVGHFNVTLDYNITTTYNGAVFEISDNYLGIRLGAFFGGGKKKTS
jgi:hypothetical protein